MKNLQVSTLGAFVRRERKKHLWSQSKLGILIGADGQTISNLETGQTKTLTLKSLEELVKLFGPLPEDEPPPGIDTTRIQYVHRIPEWEIDISAGVWAAVPIAELDYDDPEQRAVIDAGRFRLRIIGNCMQPTYPDGSMIEFQLMRMDIEGFEAGLDYVLCRSDGTATFKRMVGANDDSYTLGAINQQDHPGTFTVPRQEISRAARVAFILVQPDPPRPLKIRK